MVVAAAISGLARFLMGRMLSCDREEARFDLQAEHASPRMIYVHIPFCRELCPYCSFFRVPFQASVTDKYYGFLRRELQLYHELGFSFDTLYVGGGTPTVLPERLSDLISHARRLWPIREVSVETNPGCLARETVKRLRDAGVNRLSVGVQSFQDDLLETIQRKNIHGTGLEIADRLALMEGIFDTLNIDMIFNLPGQTEDLLHRDLSMLLSLKADQVTYYPLMGSMAAPPPEGRGHSRSEASFIKRVERERRYYDIISRELGGHYERATAWCFARGEGLIDEYIVEHDDYVGAGSGAFGYVNGTLYANPFSLELYAEQVATGQLPIYKAWKFGAIQRAMYEALMHAFGGASEMFAPKRRNGVAGRTAAAALRAVERMGIGLVGRGGGLLSSDRLSFYLVTLMKEFFSAVNKVRDTCRGQSVAQPDSAAVRTWVDQYAET